MSHRAACLLCFIENFLPASPAAEERGEERWGHSNTKANLFVSKEKLLAPLPDEGIDKIWRHLDTERGGGVGTRGRHAVGTQKAEFNTFLRPSGDFNRRAFPAPEQKDGRNERKSPPLFVALVRCSLGMLRSRNSNHFPWKSAGWRQPQTKPPGISAPCQRGTFGQKHVSAVLTS